jgi:uncharacterized tellurite resistance protein B-like protein
MSHSLLDTLWNFLRGESYDSSVSLLVDRHGNLINKELAAAFTAILIKMSLSDEMLQEGEIFEIHNLLREDLRLSVATSEQVFSSALNAGASSEEVLSRIGAIAFALGDDQKRHLYELAVKVADADETISRDEEQFLARIRKTLRLPKENA